MGIVNPGMLQIYDEIPKDLHEKVEDLVLNKRPDATELLNHIVQLAYVCLCDLLGPVDADEILFRVADIAKQSHPKEVVERLF